MYAHNDGTIVVVRFDSNEEAIKCQFTLNALFAEIDLRINAVFQAKEGQASLEDVSRIYASFGFSNENGWHQDAPVLVEGAEVLWPLAGGADPDDAENLLSTMEPQNIRMYADKEALEDWQRFPHPIAAPIPDEDDFGAESPPRSRNTSGGRILH